MARNKQNVLIAFTGNSQHRRRLYAVPSSETAIKTSHYTHGIWVIGMSSLYSRRPFQMTFDMEERIILIVYAYRIRTVCVCNLWQMDYGAIRLHELSWLGTVNTRWCCYDKKMSNSCIVLLDQVAESSSICERLWWDWGQIKVRGLGQWRCAGGSIDSDPELWASASAWAPPGGPARKWNLDWRQDSGSCVELASVGNRADPATNRLARICQKIEKKFFILFYSFSSSHR